MSGTNWDRVLLTSTIVFAALCLLLTVIASGGEVDPQNAIGNIADRLGYDRSQSEIGGYFVLIRAAFVLSFLWSITVGLSLLMDDLPRRAIHSMYQRARSAGSRPRSTLSGQQHGKA